MEIRRDLPGAELVEAGLADLRAGRDSAPALLVASFSRRLRRLGFVVPESPITDPAIRLYRLIEQTRPNAHHHYNALRRLGITTVEALAREDPASLHVRWVAVAGPRAPTLPQVRVWIRAARAATE